MFMKMGQILSAIVGEKFLTFPATRIYSNDCYDSENEPGLFQSSRGGGLVFQILTESAAKKVNGDCSKNDESIIGKKEIVEDDASDGYNLGNEAGIETSTVPLNGDIDEPAIFQSRGSVFQVSSEPFEKKGNDDNPQTEVCNHKDKAINKKWKKKRIIEDGVSIKAALVLEKGDEEKPLSFQLWGGPVFQVHIDPVAKKGNGKALADQKRKQRKEINHHKNVGINKSLTLVWKKKENVNKNEEILIKFSNVTKKKETDENLCKKEAIIKFSNVTKKETDENLCKNEAIIKFSNVTKKKETDVNLCKNEAIIKSLNVTKKKETDVNLCKNEAIIKSLNVTKKQEEIVEDLCKNEAIIKSLNVTNNKEIVENLSKSGAINKICIVENEKEKAVIFKEPAAIKVDYNKIQIKEIHHHKDDELIDKAIEKEPDEDNPQAETESDHHKDETIYNKNYLGTNEIVWLKHYNNKQKILMVGEGDFSFSASLAVAFGSSASNITATSFNNSEYLRFNYKNAKKNIEKLTNRGATVRHGVDATKMSNYSYWKDIKFDRIIYNFPYSGCAKSKSRQSQLRQHLELVRGFLVNAKKMLEKDGEIHISHKTNGFHAEWKLKELALVKGLCLVQEVKFNKSDYPGYETKQGYRGNWNFQCYPSSTYIFASIPY